MYEQAGKDDYLKLETVDDLQKILELKKKRKTKRVPVRKHKPAPEIVVRLDNSPIITYKAGNITSIFQNTFTVKGLTVTHFSLPHSLHSHITWMKMIS